MQFGSRNLRTALVMFLAWIAADAAIAYGLASLSEPGLGETTTSKAAFFFVIMQAAALFVWFKRTIVIWMHFLAFGRRTGRKAMLAALKSSGYPEPARFYGGPSEYLEEITKNEALPADVRIRPHQISRASPR